VLENNKPIVNGNPGVEPGNLNDAAKFTTLRSALALPLRPPGGMRGVLALYALEKDSFGKDQLDILLSVESILATTIENALQGREVNAMNESLAGLAKASATHRSRIETGERASR
jgi:GAF domain-containing protein